MKISDETKVGVLTAFGLTILILGYSFLKGNNLFHKDIKYYVLYDKIEGLHISDAVQINGLKVGKVANMTLLPRTHQILTEFSIEKADLAIPRNSVARIVSSDLLGTKAVELELSEDSVMSASGDTLLSAVQADLMESVNEMLLPVKIKAEDLMGSLDTLVSGLQVLFEGDAIPNTFNNLEDMTENLKRASVSLDSLLAMDELEGIITNVESFTNTLKQNEKNIDNLLANLSSLSDSLAGSNIPSMVTSLDSTLREAKVLLHSINNGEGTIAQLINDPELYNQLTNTMTDLDSLLVDVQNRPDRYVHISVFGKKNKD